MLTNLNLHLKLMVYEFIKEFSSVDYKEIVSQQYDNVSKMFYILCNDLKNSNDMGRKWINSYRY